MGRLCTRGFGLRWRAAARSVLQALPSAVTLGLLSYALHSRRDDLRPLVGMLYAMASQHAHFRVASGAF